MLRDELFSNLYLYEGDVYYVEAIDYDLCCVDLRSATPLSTWSRCVIPIEKITKFEGWHQL